MRHRLLLNLLIFAYISGHSVQAQEIEVGGGASLIQYKGDLNPTFNPFRSRPGIGIFARYNTEKGVNFRLSGLVGQIGTNPNKSRDPFINQLKDKDEVFPKSIFEYSAIVEYNFLDFRTKRSRYVTDWTPYIFGGISLLAIGDIMATPTPTFQLGFGVKKQLNSQINISAEFGSRFTYKDDKTIDEWGHPASFDINAVEFIDPDIPQVGTPNKNISFDDLLKIRNPSKAQRDAQYAAQLMRRLSYPATLQADKYFIFQISVSYLFQRVYCPK